MVGLSSQYKHTIFWTTDSTAWASIRGPRSVNYQTSLNIGTPCLRKDFATINLLAFKLTFVPLKINYFFQ